MRYSPFVRKDELGMSIRFLNAISSFNYRADAFYICNGHIQNRGEKEKKNYLNLCYSTLITKMFVHIEITVLVQTASSSGTHIARVHQQHEKLERRI